MSELERLTSRAPAPEQLARLASRRDQLRFARAVANLERRSVLRQLAVDHEAVIASSKVAGIGAAAKLAVVETAGVRQLATALGGNDPILIDDLNTFVEAAKIGLVEVVLGLATSYAQEGRRL